MSLISRKTLLGVFSLCLNMMTAGYAANSTQPSNHVDDFRLIDQNGRSRELYYYSDAKAIILFVQGNGCPIVQQSIPELKALRKEFAPKGVIFLMLNASSQDSRQEIAQESSDYDIDFPILKDTTQEIAQSLGIIRTAEAILIDPIHWSILYRGPIDDSINYGMQKPAATHHYLQDALNNALKGLPISQPQVTTLGCLISYPRAKDISYTQEIAPILEQKCMTCHYQGNKATWPMSSYEKVTGWAPMMRETIRTGRMPPWDADPEYGKFTNDISLSTSQARALLEWIDAGSPRGQGKDPLPSFLYHEEKWPLGKPDMILSMEHPQQIPASGILPYRYIPLAPKISKDLWLRAVDIEPQNIPIIHHAELFLLSQPLNAEPSMVEGLILNRDLILVGWTPGTTLTPPQPPLANFLPAHSYPVLEIHYTPNGKPQTDNTHVGLYFYRSKLPPKQIHFHFFQNYDLKIPPGDKEYKAAAQWTPGRAISITMLGPHMHHRGRYVELLVRYPDGHKETLLSVLKYRFDWQHAYPLKNPKKIPAGSTIIMEGAYDNSAQNYENPDPTKQVSFGLATTDEMFQAFIWYFDGT